MGESITDVCFVDGVAFPCLLDSGSQVTVISHSIFKSLRREMFPLSDLVLWHGGGGKIPYLGWTRVRLGLKHDFVGTKRQYDTLVLIVPDSPQTRHQIIIGTNTGLFRHLRNSCRQTAGARYLQKLPIHSWCANIYRKADKKAKLGADGAVGVIRSKYHVTLPAGSTRQLQGSFRNPLHGNNVVLVDVPRKQQPSILLKSYITEVGASINKISVEVTNLSDTDLCIPAGKVLAEVTIPDNLCNHSSHQ